MYFRFKPHDFGPSPLSYVDVSFMSSNREGGCGIARTKDSGKKPYKVMLIRSAGVLYLNMFTFKKGSKGSFERTVDYVGG